MSAGDPLKVEADDVEVLEDNDATQPKTADSGTDSVESTADTGSSKPDNSVEADSPEADDDGVEAYDDDAWLDACRDETTDDIDEANHEKAEKAEKADSTIEVSDSKAPESAAVAERIAALSAGVLTLSDDVVELRRRFDEIDDDDETALADLTARVMAAEKTSNDAMGKYGHAIGVISERIGDFEERAHDSAFNAAAEAASPSKHDTAVAPYIANAERELEAAKESGPVDIFDRIAQAAESEYDGARSSTVSRAMNELVDDRRVGTKRWTPSKTVKKRMEKLEAARRAHANGEPPVTDAVEETAATTTSETVSETATEAAAAVQPKVEPTIGETDRVVISRRRKQPVVERDTVEEDQTDEAEAQIEDEDDDAALRVVPGVRGRRRDRARKSRLDEDFEKIFDEEEGKPSIGSLRRKLRGKDKPDEEDVAEDAGEAGASSVTEETFGADAAAPAAKAGFMAKLAEAKSKLFKTKKSPAPVAEAETEAEEETLVEAFEADSKQDGVDLEFDDTEVADDEDWEQIVQTEQRQRQITTPVILIGVAIAAVGAGFFLWRTFFGA